MEHIKRPYGKNGFWDLVVNSSNSNKVSRV